MSIQSIGVFCGSSLGYAPIYEEMAKKLGEFLALQNISLIYGGAKVGLMGAIADSVLAGGGRVVGVMPELLMEKEIAHNGLSQLHVVKSMHERKALIHDLSDAFIMMPGGVGSLDEFFEMITWAQLGYHHKACSIYNVNHYFDKLLAFLDHVESEGFIKSIHRRMPVVESDPKKLLDSIEQYSAPKVNKWIAKGSARDEVV
ncbi:MAG: TIGR00730 family Rossman fold protein [Coxiellaceae bacterium]|nr:TIGR00730 family Rossman fold protein [Coxiellaceae bacterium]